MNNKLVMGVAASSLAVVIGWPVLGAEAQSPTPLHIATNTAQVCGSTLLLSYSQERLVGREWTVQQDRGRVKAQVHGINGRYQPGGAWLDVPSVSGGEGRLRVSVQYVTSRGVLFDKVRVAFVDSRIASSAKVPDWLCGQPATGRGPWTSPTPPPRRVAAPQTTTPPAMTTSSTTRAVTTPPPRVTTTAATSTTATWTPTETTSSTSTSSTIPATTTATAASSSVDVVGYSTVTPGAYCSPVGSIGVSSGKTYVCSGPGRARWRR